MYRGVSTENNKASDDDAKTSASSQHRVQGTKEGELERLLTRPYTAPLPTAWGGPKYAPPMVKEGSKLGRFADGAFNLVFGTSVVVVTVVRKGFVLIFRTPPKE